MSTEIISANGPVVIDDLPAERRRWAALAIFAALAEKNHATLIPYFLEGVGGDPALNQWDRVHPNAAGQRVLAENVWRVLKPMLPDSAVVRH